MQLVVWLQANYAQALQALAGLTIVLELIVRLFIPTSQAMGFLERLGSLISSIMDFLKVPVLIKGPAGVVLASPKTADSISESNSAK